MLYMGECRLTAALPPIADDCQRTSEAIQRQMGSSKPNAKSPPYPSKASAKNPLDKIPWYLHRFYCALLLPMGNDHGKSTIRNVILRRGQAALFQTHEKDTHECVTWWDILREHILRCLLQQMGTTQQLWIRNEQGPMRSTETGWNAGYAADGWYQPRHAPIELTPISGGIK